MSGVTVIRKGDFVRNFRSARSAAMDEGKKAIETEIHPFFDAWCPKDTGLMVGTWNVTEEGNLVLKMGYSRLSETGFDVANQCENDPDFGGTVPGTGGRPLGRAFDAGSDKVLQRMSEAYIKEVGK